MILRTLRRESQKSETHNRHQWQQINNKSKIQINLNWQCPSLLDHVTLYAVFFLNNKYSRLVVYSVPRCSQAMFVCAQSPYVTEEGNTDQRGDSASPEAQQGLQHILIPWPRFLLQPGRNFHCASVAKLVMKMRPKLASENEVLAWESFVLLKWGMQMSVCARNWEAAKQLPNSAIIKTLARLSWGLGFPFVKSN